MKIDELKELEHRATPGPWKREYDDLTEEEYIEPTGIYAYGKAAANVYADTDLVVALRNLAPELLALWEAAEKFGKPEWDFMGRNGFMAGPDFHDAIERLRKKAESMDA